jgi:carboxyl-terminal processing protease
MYIYLIKLYNLRFCTRNTLFLIILSLTACTQTEKKYLINPENILKNEVKRTLSKGLQQISQRYIENISVEQLALQGLRGLSSLDPTLQVNKTHDTVIIESQLIKRHTYTAPAVYDSSGWAKLIVDAISDSKKNSIILSQAKMTRIYEAIFDGSLSSLDTFSRYANEQDARKNREKRSGFGGIGIRFKISQKGIVVNQVFSATPAFKIGIKSNDIITHIDRISLTNIKHEDALAHLRGKIGSTIDLRLLRPSKISSKRSKFVPHSFLLKRDQIIIPTTSYSLRNDVLYIKITSFNNQTSKHLATIIKDVFNDVNKNPRKKAKGIIIDLRDNPGGLLQQAVKVSNLFLENGRIIATKGRHPASTNNYEADGTDITGGLPLVILINGRSASAAEIVAAALQDNDRAVIVGSSSYGKGTIQNVISLPNGGEITITWSRFQAPSGYYLHKIGVSPTICVPNAKEFKATEYIYKTLIKANQVTTILEARQTSAYPDKIEIGHLKKNCPANTKKNYIDIKIAEKLLTNNALYQRIKALNPAAAALSNY